ncbi:hypothetical protein ACG04R_18570 [Roseateles sp. BYS78W]|uniref:DUF4136 domain-containing protein n=1 Tax=Pelomonas candidula TaxID=3299025 RepID=A0ABW7HFL9_9BURK
MKPTAPRIIRWHLVAVTTLVTGACCAAPESPDAKTSAVLSVTPIFGELFATEMPLGFKLQAEVTQGATYRRSIILESDPDRGPWTQRFLVQGTAGQGAVAGVSPAAYAMQIAASFQKACPSTFMGSRVLEGRIRTGQPAYTMVIACGSHTLTTNSQPTSEITLVSVIKGDKNVYSVQWSDRAAPIDKAPTPDRLLIQQRLRIMTSMLVCAPVEGETAPYPSCTSR